MINTHWNQLFVGQVIKFRYKGISSKRPRSILREVIVLDPRYFYKKKSTGRVVELLIGLEIDNQVEPSLRPNELNELITLLSRTGELFRRQTVVAGATPRIRAIYKQLELFIKKHKLFKTYLLRECRKYRVFHENKVLDTNLITDTLEMIVNDYMTPETSEEKEKLKKSRDIYKELPDIEKIEHGREIQQQLYGEIIEKGELRDEN